MRPRALIIGITMLLATGTAHATVYEYPITPDPNTNPLVMPKPDVIAKVPHREGETDCKLTMGLVKAKKANDHDNVHLSSNCWMRDAWLRLHSPWKSPHVVCDNPQIDKVVRQDDVSYLEYTHCGSESRVYLYVMRNAGEVTIYKTENY